jgi:hypothetical protein
MPWKGLCISTVLVLLGAEAAQADFYYEQELYTSASGGQPPRTTRIAGFLSGSKVRAEDHSSKISDIIITRLDEGVLRVLDPVKMTYVELPVPGMNEEQAPPFPVTVTETNQTKKIGPYQCTRFEVHTEKSTINLWLSTDIDLPADEVSTYWQAGTRLYPVTLTRQLTKLPGFPVRVEVVSQGASVVTTVTAVVKQEVPAFLFDVPRSYQRSLAIKASPEPAGPNASQKAEPSPPPQAGAKP